MIEDIRLAAALMRNRAKAATPGPWKAARDEETEGVYAGDVCLADVHEWSMGRGNVHHIASWHPIVALAIADWLDEVNPIDDDFGAAIAVASAYLREEL